MYSHICNKYGKESDSHLLGWEKLTDPKFAEGCKVFLFIFIFFYQLVHRFHPNNLMDSKEIKSQISNLDQNVQEEMNNKYKKRILFKDFLLK